VSTRRIVSAFLFLAKEITKTQIMSNDKIQKTKYQIKFNVLLFGFDILNLFWILCFVI